MPILRAGPFATTFDASRNEPGSPTSSIVPVNCNRYDWANDAWKAYLLYRKEESTVSEEYDSSSGGVFAFDTGTESLSGPSETMRAIIKFAYQASQDWSFSGSSYSVEVGDTGISGPEDSIATITVDIDGSEEFEDEDLGFLSASVSGALDSIVFPATVVPIFVQIDMSLGSTQGGSSEGAISISLPLNT